jgi:RNA polymerase sigma-70 factor (ECF subfamily)
MAEDAMQDALLSAWNKRDQFDRGARLDTWIHRIAINAALQILRKNKPERYEALEEEPEGNLPTPEYLHAEEELGNELSTALAKLSNIERISFVLKHLEQWRLKEIAAELDTTVGTIKQALFRAVKKLRVSMSDLRSAS